MQQIRQLPKTKKTARCVVFLSDNNSWWSIGDVNITFDDDPEYDIKEIRELSD